MKMSRWSKAATSLVVFSRSRPLPKTSPDMSPTPTVVNGHASDIDVHFAEMALDRFPGAAGGDAHLLVIVAGRAAGGEGVAEPEVVGDGKFVGDVREGGGALVGGDHQIRIVALVAHHGRRRHHADRAGADIVGDVEKRRNEELVGGRALRPGSPRAGPPAGNRFGTKPPLAPTGTITAFFTFCALTRPRISVRKSSGRSDQRMPPRATLPKRRCTPSTRGE